MAESKDDERDEEWFKEVYGKEYTGPVRPGSDARDNSSKRSLTEASVAEPDEDEGPPDPNAVPTDFTSREAKVWEAKAKAIERNWKKKKEEELICRICGEYGHFSQGCPSTLGVNRKQSELVEKIPVKDRRLKPRIIGTSGATIQGIEKDTGCRLKLEDNVAAGNGSFFVRISGNNRVMIGKAVAAVKKLLDQVHHDRKSQNSYRSHESDSRGANANTMAASQMQHIAGQQAHHDPSMLPYPGQDVPYYGDGAHGNIGQLEARRQWEAENQNGSFPYGYKGDRGRPLSAKRGDFGPERELGRGDFGPERELGYDQQSSGQTLEGLEHSFVQETMQLTKELNDAEDKENARHREAMRDIQEQYQQKVVVLRAQQGKRREEFLRQEVQFRQQQYQQYQQHPAQVGAKHYNYDMGGAMSGGLNSSAREQPGYGNGSADRNDTRGGGYGSYRGDEGYHNSSHSYRNSGYEPGMPHSRNQAYDAGPYRY
eukprot:c24889_g2_i2 orf=528-1979(-)